MSDRLTVNVLEMNGESYRLGQRKARQNKAYSKRDRQKLALKGQSIRATASYVISADARMLERAHAAILLTPKWQHFTLHFGSVLLWVDTSTKRIQSKDN